MRLIFFDESLKEAMMTEALVVDELTFCALQCYSLLQCIRTTTSKLYLNLRKRVLPYLSIEQELLQFGF